MKLNVKDRLIFRALFPREGDILSQTLIKDIGVKINIDQKELNKISFKRRPDGRGFEWDEKKAKIIDVDFTKAELSVLKAQVDKLDKEKKITHEILDICVKVKNAK